MLNADDLGSEQLDLTLRADPGAARYDVFATANFFNFKPWAASLEYLLGRGVEATRSHDEALVQRFLDGLDRRKFKVTVRRQDHSARPWYSSSRGSEARAKDIYDACRPAGARRVPRRRAAFLPTHLQHGRRHRPRADLCCSGFSGRSRHQGSSPDRLAARVKASPCAGT